MKLYLPPYPMNSARKQLSWMWSVVAMLCFSANMMFANNDNAPQVACQMGCEDLIHLTLDENCEGEVTVNMMLVDSTGCGPNLSLGVIIVAPGNDTLTGTTITSAYVGQTLSVTVYDPASRQSCWGEILVEDKLIDSLVCRNDTIDCSVLPTPGNTHFPFDSLEVALGNIVITPAPGADPNLGPWTVTGFDACGPATLTLRERSETSNCGQFNKTVFRMWEIEDGSRNKASCKDTIYLENPAVTSIDFPENKVDANALNCEDRRDDTQGGNCGPILGWNVIQSGPFAGHPSPDAVNYPCGSVKWEGTGRPTVGACSGIQMTFRDLRINHCTVGESNGCFKVLRYWTVLDWCSGTVFDSVQLIKVVDSLGPQIADIADITISTDVWRCEVDWLATAPWLMDNCSSEPLSYTVSSTGGTVQQLPNGRYRILGLVPGMYNVTYSAFDCCGNQADSTIKLTIVDDVPPVAVCDAHTVVSITTSQNSNDPHRGTTKIFATTFDDGSYDNCDNAVFFKVIRMDELDANGNNRLDETVVNGDWLANECSGANGDDDLRTSPAAYRRSQAYFDDFVKFCCEDVDPNNPVMVVFRVFDKDPEPYTFGKQFPGLVPAGENPDDYNGVLPEQMAQGGELYGHYSDCMVEVTVQDKIPPYVVAPPNITVSCDFWFPFDKNNPQDYTDELDAIFGKVVPNTADPQNLDSIIINDRVCAAYNNRAIFARYAPASPTADPCYDDTYDIFWGFDGYAIDNCDIDTIEQTILPDLHCNKGTIVRRWQATDQGGLSGNIASQVITIVDCKEYYVPTVCWRFTPGDVGSCDQVRSSVYRNKLIEWPCDVEVNRCQTAGLDALSPDNLPVTFNQDRRPRWYDDACNLMGESFEDRRYTFIDGACIKIFREWTVIDWCKYEESRTNTDVVYEWHWTQVIKLMNTAGPVFQDQGALDFCGFGNPNNPTADQCVGIISLESSFEDDCTPDSLLRLDYKIDLGNNGTYDLYGYSNNRSNPFPGLGAKAFDPTLPIPDSILAVGQHSILWTAQDGCGNLGSYTQPITINDCKPPTPYCRLGISTISMPLNAGGFVDVWASDFNIGSYDNCTDSLDLVYSFSDDPLNTSIRFDCDTISGDTFDLTVYVWDLGLNGLPRNYATCGVTVRLQDCDNQTTYTVNGGILNEAGQQVKDVDVIISGYMNTTTTTSNNGQFSFNLPRGENYTVKPEKNLKPRNGVSTFDLVMISKHITGQQALNSPYKLIAADVNNTGNVSTFDIIELRKLILYINTEFPDNTSWRFVPSDYQFADANNPFTQSFPEVYTINALNANMDASFAAIKIGDVNGSASVNNLTSGATTRSSGDELVFQVKDQELKAGETYRIDVQAKDFAQVTGYQFTMNYDAAKVTVNGVEAGELTGLGEGNFGLIANKAAITTSWNGKADLADDATVFTLELTATANTRISDVLSITSELTTAEAYNEQAALMDVSLQFNTTPAQAGFALYQNAPNPFRTNTVISFNLPATQQAELSIYDVSGKVLKVFNRTFDQGYNEVSLNNGELNASGILYYTLKTANNTATRKMILID